MQNRLSNIYILQLFTSFQCSRCVCIIAIRDSIIIIIEDEEEVNSILHILYGIVVSSLTSSYENTLYKFVKYACNKIFYNNVLF